MKNALLTLGSGLLVATAAPAATIEYDFEDTANISVYSPQTADSEYTAPDFNDFGSGITVSSFTLTDRDAGEYSRFVNIGGGSVEAAVGSGGSDLLASFTITIDDTVIVGLNDIVFDSSARWTQGVAVDDVFVDFYTTVGGIQGSTSSFDWTHDGDPAYQSQDGNSVDLSALTGLTNTTVTFTWELGTDRNNTFARIAQGLDDITLTGTIVPVPEPSTIALVSGFLGCWVMRRRR
ncbi:MAG: PEP-CTERM sorting domain-containing protein [Verrucomicrobiales bacterium]|nr:PEP-CTERM sorting domain-containing protein [Verrucomicrobiota bacterium JB025]